MRTKTWDAHQNPYGKSFGEGTIYLSSQGWGRWSQEDLWSWLAWQCSLIGQCLSGKGDNRPCLEKEEEEEKRRKTGRRAGGEGRRGRVEAGRRDNGRWTILRTSTLKLFSGPSVHAQLPAYLHTQTYAHTNEKKIKMHPFILARAKMNSPPDSVCHVTAP